jgi:hypothetical protein
MRACVVAATAVLAPAVASASDFAISGGVTEVVAPTAEHIGAYPSVAVAMIVPTRLVTLVPAIGVEWSPEIGAWGFTCALIADLPVTNHLGIDVIATAVHDQVGGDWQDAGFYVALGAGVSVFRRSWALSPSLSVVRGLNVDAWTLAPALSISHVL